ncbi:hypothetical protein [Streptomyces sp. NPDC058371]|uniref:hypothetical protein n=1 Tax=Streptomyces sp. NPDC058371 TaxID=3346463 RepID=UPI0036665550
MSLVVSLAACSSGDEATSKPQEICSELLGADGVKWVKRASKQETGLLEAGDLKSAKSQFYENARGWDPKSKEVPTFASSSMCGVVKAAEDTPRGVMSISYGASIIPFAFPFDEESDISDPRTVTPVNSDVKLVKEEGERGVATYYVYIKCQVPGASKG